MNACSFYSYDDINKGLDSCNIKDTSRPLIVNCAGCVSTDFPFNTENPQGRDDIYLMIITEGELSVHGAPRIAAAGDVIVFPPNVCYSYSFDGTVHLSYLWIHFTGSYSSQFLEELSLKPLPSIHRHAHHGSVIPYFNKLFDTYLKGGKKRDLLLSSLLERILLCVSGEGTDEEQPLLRSLSYIHMNYNTDIKVPYLASLENLSVSRYSAVFTQTVGVPPQKYLIDLRIRNACELLKNTDMSVKQTGISVGYPDPHFFSKLFKKYMGLSPLEYRNSYFL